MLARPRGVAAPPGPLRLLRKILRRSTISSAQGRAQQPRVAGYAYAHGMPRYSADDLVGAKEIAARLGVSSSVVHDWRRRHPAFPQPVVQLSMGLIWSWPEIQRWAKATGRA